MKRLIEGIALIAVVWNWAAAAELIVKYGPAAAAMTYYAVQIFFKFKKELGGNKRGEATE